MGFESPSFEENPAPSSEKLLERPVKPDGTYQPDMDRYVEELAAYNAQQAALESQNAQLEQVAEQIEMSAETIARALEEADFEFDNPDLNNKDFRKAVQEHDRKIDDDVAVSPGKYANWTDLVRKTEAIDRSIN